MLSSEFLQTAKNDQKEHFYALQHNKPNPNGGGFSAPSEDPL